MILLLDCQIASPPYAFTILQALYYFSTLAFHNSYLVETDENGNLVSIELADSAYPTAALLATGEPDPNTKPLGDAFIIYPPPQRQYYRLALVSKSLGHSSVLELWKSENCLGGKMFRGTLMPNYERVVVKL
jgi:hypothetical protein